MQPVRPKENFLVFGAPLLEEAEIDEVLACMRSAWIGTGPRVARFEADVARYKGVQQAAALNSCTAALHLSMLVADLKAGDEVITSPLTFCATVNAIMPISAKLKEQDVEDVIAAVKAALGV